jgi:phospholipid/cholesterol/gamma-HCH transport system permease protein
MAETPMPVTRFEQRLLTILGGTLISMAEAMGRVVILTRQTLYWIKSAERKTVFEQIIAMGVESVPVTTLTSLFTGMVLALQTGFSFRKVFNEPIYVGTVVGLSLVKELGPVLTAVVVSGRVGAAIAAELGTMKVTEQIDALESLAISPVRYLAVPRLLAATIMMPILVIFANIVALIGAYLVSSFFLDISTKMFFDSVQRFFHLKDIFGGLFKALFFGSFTALIGVKVGFAATGGAEGVGNATIRAFVLSATMVLVLDYTLWMVLF